MMFSTTPINNHPNQNANFTTFHNWLIAVKKTDSKNNAKFTAQIDDLLATCNNHANVEKNKNNHQHEMKTPASEQLSLTVKKDHSRMWNLLFPPKEIPKEELIKVLNKNLNNIQDQLLAHREKCQVLLIENPELNDRHKRILNHIVGTIENLYATGYVPPRILK